VTKRSFRRLLVTGGAGFIGSNFVRHFRKAHPRVQVVVVDNLTYAGVQMNLAALKKEVGFEFVKASVRNKKVLDEVASTVDAIVHIAAHTHVDRSLMSPVDFVDVNVVGTAVLCEAAVKHHHQVFLYVSTDEVYGEVLKGRSKEQDALAPRSPYSASKAAGEHVVRAFAQSFGLPTLITRGSNSYGPWQFPEKLIPLLITNAIADLPLPLYNDGSAVRDFLYVDDHCRAIDLVLHQAPSGETYNVGTGTETSGKQIAEEIVGLLRKPKTLIDFVADRPGHDYRYALDVSRINRLGWQAKVPLRQGLGRTVRWYLNNADWWKPLKARKYWEYYRRNYKPLAPEVR